MPAHPSRHLCVSDRALLIFDLARATLLSLCACQIALERSDEFFERSSVLLMTILQESHSALLDVLHEDLDQGFVEVLLRSEEVPA